MGKPSAPPPLVIESKATGLPFQLRLQSDALIELRIGGLPPWLLSEEQTRDLNNALSSMATDSRDRRIHLRGADRWMFRREGERVFAKIYDQEASLASYTVGTIRSRSGVAISTCGSCHKKLEKGARAYRAHEWESGWRIQWSTVRFCERCPVNTVEARAASGLRVIDGGKRKTNV